MADQPRTLTVTLANNLTESDAEAVAEAIRAMGGVEAVTVNSRSPEQIAAEVSRRAEVGREYGEAARDAASRTWRS